MADQEPEIYHLSDLPCSCLQAVPCSMDEKYATVMIEGDGMSRSCPTKGLTSELMAVVKDSSTRFLSKLAEAREGDECYRKSKRDKSSNSESKCHRTLKPRPIKTVIPVNKTETALSFFDSDNVATALHKDQCLRYDVEFPHRVALRLEYLMGSHTVCLNSKEYFQKLHERLLESQSLQVRATHNHRTKEESRRMKKLIIAGEMEATDDLEYLRDNPMFRVNRMMKRLDNFEQSFHDTQFKRLPAIKPVEPFEFDSDRYFLELHKGRPGWIPKSEKIMRKEILKGKIERAKQRYRENKLRKEYTACINKFNLNKLAMQEKELSPPATNSGKSLQGLQSRAKFIRQSIRNLDRLHSIKEQEYELALEKEAEKRELLLIKDRKRKQKAMERVRKMDEIFLSDMNKESEKYIEKHKLRKTKEDESTFFKKRAVNTLEPIFSKCKYMPEPKSKPKGINLESERDAGSLQSDTKTTTHSSASSNIDSLVLPEGFNMTSKSEFLLEDSPSFREIRKKYKIKIIRDLFPYDEIRNRLVETEIDPVNDPYDLFEIGKSIYNMGRRENIVAEDFVKSLEYSMDHNQMISHETKNNEFENPNFN